MMDSRLFRAQVAELLIRVGVDARVDGLDVVIAGRYRFQIARRSPTRVQCCSTRFTKNQASECAALIVNQLPTRMREEKEREAYAEFRRSLTILAAGGDRGPNLFVNNGFKLTDDVLVSGDAANKTYIAVFTSKDLSIFRRVLDFMVLLSKGGYDFTDGEALLRAFFQCDGDNMAMLAYSDWLEENGHDGRAANIRRAILNVEQGAQ